jgi:UDP-N-acetylmuramoylalanine--D-glutamate ligase
MTPITVFAGHHVALFGLGGSGLATARSLKQGGAMVTCWDDNPASIEKAKAEGLTTADLRTIDWANMQALILAPGVPLTHPAPHWSVALANGQNVPVIGDVELFFRQRAASVPDAPVICITGTNGKSTTTALIAHVLASAGRDVQMGGNIGTAILLLEPPSRDRIHIVECSSFQIDLTPSIKPTVGIQLNLTPDHLDRHGTMENYAAIKERLVATSDVAVIGVDDTWSKAMADRRAHSGLKLERISAESPVDQGFFSGFTAKDGTLETRLVRVDARKPSIVAELTGIPSLRGAHNAQNAAAAFAACAALGLTEAEIAAGLATYPGLAHRMEQLGRKGHVVFINDSKATNADSTEKALTAFNDIFWILGGKSKEGGIEPLRRYFRNIRKAYLIGAASDEFAATLEGSVPYERCGTLDVATAKATADAAAYNAKGDVCVLLSPACASYDQFPNFEVRGNAFRELVAGILAKP